MALTVAVEGLPGCGKTTIIDIMTERLTDYGLTVKTVDIESTGYAPILRKITKQYPLGHPIRVMLFWILRLQQYETMEMAEENVDIIFADRFWGSTIAFDVYGNGIPTEALDWVSKEIKNMPDITLLFEAPLDTVRERKETESMRNTEFAHRVETGYQELAHNLGWKRIDATRTPQKVTENCLFIILDRLIIHQQ